MSIPTFDITAQKMLIVGGWRRCGGQRPDHPIEMRIIPLRRLLFMPRPRVTIGTGMISASRG